MLEINGDYMRNDEKQDGIGQSIGDRKKYFEEDEKDKID